MKKLLLVLLTAVSMMACAPTLATASPDGGGMFGRGEKTENTSKGGFPGLPGHGETGDQPATPTGTGILALSLLGGAYLVGKKSKELRK